MEMKNHNKRMQPDFGELALASAADAKRYSTLVSSNGLFSPF